MEWLVHRGHEVVGVELSPIACRAFFEENKRSFSERTEGDFVVYGGKNITLWCGDLFKLPPSALNGVTSIYDRAALVALPSDIRLKYVRHVDSLLKEAGADRVTELLITFEYDPARFEGPPFPVPAVEVKSHFGDRYQIETLARQEDESFRTHPRFSEPFPVEVVYRLTSK